MNASVVVAMALGGLLWAQEPNPTQNPPAQNSQGQTTSDNTQNPTNPVYRVQVVSRSIAAVSYRNRSGWTRVGFQGTALAPRAKGKADVNSRKGYIQVKAEIKGLPPATGFGNEYLTYVLWAITPDGRPKNLGEVLLNDNGDGDLDVTTELQSFGLIVTAEPYFAVTQPSDVVVMENIIQERTVGKYELVDAKYELLPRGMYTQRMSASAPRVQMDKKAPLELYEARNAINLARASGADKLASDTFEQAQRMLQQAEDYQSRKAGTKPVTMASREAVQKAEDARIITRRREREMAMQKAKDQAAASKAAAEQAAQQQAEAERQAALDAQRRAEAERAQAQADLQAEKAKQAAAEAERLRAQAETEKNAARQQMLQQLNTIMETRETARGLIMNMSDVLFDFGQYSLKPEAREKLAKVSGILLAHPGLNLQVEGYTDNVGSDEFNQKLSDQRANAVSDYLISQGIPQDRVSARGFGKNNPIASNDTAAGRQQNRRVQIVVSGGAIGTTAGQPTAAPAPSGPQ
jgi:outer membrane protein OmpA-like peptidoglycan-associated protein